MKETMPSAEELAKINKERTLSDAELIKGGAEYKTSKEGSMGLDVAGEQVEAAKKEMEEAKNLEAILTPEQSKERMGEYFNALKTGYDESQGGESTKADKLVYDGVKESLLNTDRKELTSYPSSDSDLFKDNRAEWNKLLHEAQAEWRDIARGLFAGTKKSFPKEDMKFQRLGFHLSKITETNNPDQLKEFMLKDDSLTRNFKGGEERLKEIIEEK